MPQQSLLSEHPPMTAMTIKIESFPRTLDPETVHVTVSVAIGAEPLKARSVLALEGLERDLLNTLVSEATSVYMYGETPKDVVRTVAQVKQAARAHRQSHGF